MRRTSGGQAEDNWRTQRTPRQERNAHYPTCPTYFESYWGHVRRLAGHRKAQRLRDRGPLSSPGSRLVNNRRALIVACESIRPYDGGMITVSDQLVTATEAAEMLGVSSMRVRQLAQAGSIGRKIGCQWLFTVDEINRFRRVHKRTPGPEKKSDSNA